MSIKGNLSKMCGRNGAAGHPLYNNGITIAGPSSGPLMAILTGNVNLDLDQVPSTMQYEIYLGGPSAGTSG